MTKRTDNEFITTLGLIDSAINRWTRWLYPDDDDAVPYQDTPAPWRRKLRWR